MPNTGDHKKPKKKATTKRPATKRPASKKRPAKKGYNSGAGGIWFPISGSTFGGGYSHADPLPEAPSPADLLCAFEDVAYSCVTRISSAVGKAASAYKLCVTTGRDEQAPKSLTKSLRYQDRLRIEAKHKRYTRKAAEVEEVTDHPVLDLLDRPNPLQSFHKLVELTVEYLGLVGSAFWYKSRNELGQVAELWLLPSHLVQIDADDVTGALRGYKFKSGSTEETYPPADVIHFRWTDDPLDPYTSFGVSPLRAIWQRFSLLRQEQGSWQAVLRNMAFPTLLANPPDNESWTPQQAERIEKQLAEKFRWGNQGGILAVQDSAKYTPLATPPKDLAALQMYDSVRKAIIQEYDLPLPIMDMSDTTFASAEVAKRLFQEGCIVPLLDGMFETISHHLLPPRMFLAGDDLLQPDKVFDLQRTTALVGANVITVNESRVEQGYEPLPGLDKLLVELSPNIGTASAQTFQGASFTGGRVKQKGYKSTVPDAKALAEVLRGLYQRLGQDVLARLKGADGLRTKSFFSVTDWKDEIVRNLVPVLRVYLAEGGTAVLGETGGALRTLPAQRLDDAVQRAALVFAESTLSTTEASITDAVAATRGAIEQGLSQGEANAQLAKRVGDIFTDLAETRAVLIAETESSRAKHAGEVMAIQEAGVTAKKVWLEDHMACPQCRGLAAKGAVGLDEAFSGERYRAVLPDRAPAGSSRVPLLDAVRVRLVISAEQAVGEGTVLGDQLQNDFRGRRRPRVTPSGCACRAALPHGFGVDTGTVISRPQHDYPPVVIRNGKDHPAVLVGGAARRPRDVQDEESAVIHGDGEVGDRPPGGSVGDGHLDGPLRVDRQATGQRAAECGRPGGEHPPAGHASALCCSFGCR